MTLGTFPLQISRLESGSGETEVRPRSRSNPLWDLKTCATVEGVPSCRIRGEQVAEAEFVPRSSPISGETEFAPKG